MIVDDYCFRVYSNVNPNVRTYITIYQVTEIVNESNFFAITQDTTSSKLPKVTWSLIRTTRHYTKCSSTTIEELKEEFPEVFI
jgi:hypothetical protein